MGINEVLILKSKRFYFCIIINSGLQNANSTELHSPKMLMMEITFFYVNVKLHE